jgi:hypothetical protein
MVLGYFFFVYDMGFVVITLIALTCYIIFTIVVTEWREFRSPDFAELARRLRQPVVIDGRNLYDPDLMAELGFDYTGIGRAKARGPVETDQSGMVSLRTLAA